jgi:hypothetical protein
MQFAHTFDGFSETREPYFSPDHPRTDDPDECERLAHFLESGAPILRATGRDQDWYDRSRGRSVPITTVTDGRWVWSGALAYYIRCHGLLPEPAFLNYIIGCSYTARTPSEAECAEAARALLATRPDDSGT